MLSKYFTTIVLLVSVAYALVVVRDFSQESKPNAPIRLHARAECASKSTSSAVSSSSDPFWLPLPEVSTVTTT